MNKIFTLIIFILLLNSASLPQEKDNILINITENSGSLLISDIYRYAFFPLEGLLVFIIISFWIYHLFTVRKREEANLKANIEKLRNEEIDSEPEKNLEIVRTSLLNKMKKIGQDKKIDTAKKHEIATGEIDLALKLKTITKS
jgi:hypothetical protein